MPPAPLDDRGSSPDPLQLPSPVPPHFARPALPRAGTSSETARPCSTLPSESASPPSPPEAANDGDCALPPPAKRPRTSCSAPSAWRPLPPRPPSSGQSTPSDTVKIRVKARDEWSCWSCGDQADDLQVCHAVPKRAWTAFVAQHNAGVLPFNSLADPANLITLCPNCHSQYDRYPQPGWLFYPHDLSFFVNWEEADYARRRDRWRATGEQPCRKVPLAADYTGGYRRYRINHSSITLSIMATEPIKPWSGSPTAAIVKASYAMGQILPPQGGPPPDERRFFLTLMLLYGRPEPWEDEDGAATVSSVPGRGLVLSPGSGEPSRPPCERAAAPPTHAFSAPTVSSSSTTTRQSPPSGNLVNAAAAPAESQATTQAAASKDVISPSLARSVYESMQSRLGQTAGEQEQMLRLLVQPQPWAWGPGWSSAKAIESVLKSRQRRSADARISKPRQKPSQYPHTSRTKSGKGV